MESHEVVGARVGLERLNAECPFASWRDLMVFVLCEQCYENVIDELSARKGVTVCKACLRRVTKKTCKVCGKTKAVEEFTKGRLVCKPCYAAQSRIKRREDPDYYKKVRIRLAKREAEALDAERLDRLRRKYGFL